MRPDYIKDTEINIKRLSNNTDYYNNVFKKTERLVSVIFYVLSFLDKNQKTEKVINHVSDVGFAVHEASLATLLRHETELPECLFAFQHALVRLEGVLLIAHASRILTDDLLALVVGELDGIQRYIKNHYSLLAPTGISTAPLLGVRPSAPASRAAAPRTARPRVSARVVIPKGDISSDAHLVYSQLIDRGARIKTVLEAKPEATIKDIAEVITDVSEKTIQRELNSLIEKGQVIRQGERRWSKYSLAK